MEDRYLMS